MKKQWMLLAAGALIVSATPALATDLREAVQAALNTNPDIRQAIANKEATRAERKQAQGLWFRECRSKARRAFAG